MALEPAGLTWYNENLNIFLGDVDKANRAMASTGDAAHQAGGGFNFLGSVVTGVATGFTTFALDAVTKVSGALVQLSKDSIGVAADFQGMGVALEYAGSQYKDAADAVGGFDEIALKVGGDTRLMGVSATGAAGAMTGLLKSGLSLEDVMGNVNAYMEEGAVLGGALRASIDLAAATELDMVQASDLAVIVMSTFGKTAEEVTGAMDFLVKTADASVAEVSDLSAALINVGPTAAAAGISFEEVNTALALLSTRGIRGAEAGTALKSMMANIRRPTKGVTEELNKWGISLYDGEGRMYSLMEIIGQFEIALEGATEEERALAIQTIAGTYGMNAMNTLIGEGVSGWQAMSESIGSATDMSAKAQAQSQTFAGQQEALNGVIETLKIRIGTALLPALTNLMGLFSELVERYGPQLTSLFERVGEILESVVGAAFALVSGDIENFQEYLGEVIGYLANLVTGGNASVETINSIWSVLDKLWAAAQTAAQFVSDLVTSFKGVEDSGSALQIILDSITTWLAENWPIIAGRLTEWGEKFWDWVRDVAVPAASEKLQNLLDAFVEWAQKPSTHDSLAKIGEATAKAMIDGLELVLTSVEVLTPVLVKAAGALAEAAAASIIPVGSSIGAGLATGVINSFGDALDVDWMKEIKFGVDFSKEGKKIEKDFPKPFKKATDEVEDVFKDFSKELVGSSIIPDMMKEMDGEIESGMKIVLKTIQSGINDMINAFTSKMRDFASRGQEIAQSVASGISSKWGQVSSAISDGIDDLLDRIASSLGSFANKGKDIASNIASGISGRWGTVTSAVSDGINDLLSRISSSLSSFVQKGKDISSNIASGVSSRWTAVISAVSSGMDGIGTTISTKLSSIVQAGKDIATSIASGISLAWYSVTSKLSELASGLADSVVGAGSAIAEKIVSGITNSFNTYWWKVKNELGSLGSALSTAIDWVGKVASSGAKIVDGIIDGISRNWQRFVNWLKDAIAGIFGASEPTDPTSPFRSRKLQRSGEWIGNALAQGIQVGLSQGLSMSPVGMSKSVTVNIGPIALGNQMDAEVFAQRVKQVVAGAI